MAPAERPGPLFRALLQVPALLYRARLGWLLGDRFLDLAHRGRRTGKLRHAVLEVVRFDRDTPEVSVIAGWGPHTQWYRNLEVAPPEEVRVGRQRWRHPEQRFLDEPARMVLLTHYVREYPRAALALGRFFDAGLLDETGVAEFAQRVRAVSFRPIDSA